MDADRNVNNHLSTTRIATLQIVTASPSTFSPVTRARDSGDVHRCFSTGPTASCLTGPVLEESHYPEVRVVRG